MRENVHNSREWNRISRARRREDSECVLCKSFGHSILATHCHHVRRVNGSLVELYEGETKNLCQRCHSIVTGIERRRDGDASRASKAEPPDRTDGDGNLNPDWAEYERKRKSRYRRRLTESGR